MKLKQEYRDKRTEKLNHASDGIFSTSSNALIRMEMFFFFEDFTFM
jgi:hypothetical protein